MSQTADEVLRCDHHGAGDGTFHLLPAYVLAEDVRRRFAVGALDPFQYG